MVQKISLYILKGAIIVWGAIVVALCIFALPAIWQGGSAEFPTASFAVQLIVVGLYITTLPFFIGLWHAFKFLGHIHTNTVFSDQAIDTLLRIKLCGVAISILYMIGVPLLFPIAQADDAPGLILIGFAIACIPVVISACLHIFQGVLQSDNKHTT